MNLPGHGQNTPDSDIYINGEIEGEGYWTRRQIVISIIALIMILILLVYLALPIVRSRQSGRSSPVPSRAPFEAVEFSATNKWPYLTTRRTFEGLLPLPPGGLAT